MKWKWLLLLQLVLGLYIVLGAVIFLFLERKMGIIASEEPTFGPTSPVYLDTIASRFLANNTCVNKEDLSRLLQDLLAAERNGDLVTTEGAGNRNGNLVTTADAGNATQDSPGLVPSVWDFTNCVFFIATVITTIGYGHIIPVTTVGKLFVVIYALVGIPLYYVALITLGRKLRKTIVDRLRKIWPEAPKGFTCTLLVLPGIFLFFFIPATTFHFVEGWGYANSLYYTFVSLSTIGFGDYIAGMNPLHQPHWSGLYHLLNAVWLFTGLLWLSIVISHVHANVGEYIYKRRIKYETMEMEQTDDGYRSPDA